jgi:hypothetical protein
MIMTVNNGQTGPKTVKGKSISSMNALKTGIFAKSPVLPFEDERAYKRHVKSMLDSLGPENALEKNLAEEIATSIWRGTRLQLNEIVQHEAIFEQLTPQMMAAMVCEDKERIEHAPEYLLDLKHAFSKKELQQYRMAYQQYLHLMQHSRGIQNYQMVWLNYQNLFTGLGNWMKGRYDPPLFLSTGKGLDMAWQNSPQVLEAAIKKYSHTLWWAIHFNDLKPQIRNWMSSWYFLNSLHKNKVTSVQEQLVKERRFCQGLIDTYMKLRKSSADHFLFQCKLDPLAQHKDAFGVEIPDLKADLRTEVASVATENEMPENPSESIT